jgi:hypothetical protein
MQGRELAAFSGRLGMDLSRDTPDASFANWVKTLYGLDFPNVQESPVGKRFSTGQAMDGADV